jgi:hypothetical protein
MRRRQSGRGMCHHKVKTVISSALMRMVASVGAPLQCWPTSPSQPGNDSMALGPRPIPSQRTWMTRVAWRASLLHPSTQCGGIIAYSRTTDTTIAQRWRASCGHGQAALCTTWGGNANGPCIRPRGRESEVKKPTIVNISKPKVQDWTRSAAHLPLGWSVSWWKGPARCHANKEHVGMD